MSQFLIILTFPSFQNKNLDLTDEEIQKIIITIDINYYPGTHYPYQYDLENKHNKMFIKILLFFYKN